MNPFDYPVAEQRVLHNMRVAARKVVPAYVAQTVQASMVYDHAYQGLALELRACVLGERLGDREHHIPFSHYASWWQHLKNDIYNLVCSHFPGLGSKLVCRWPVKHKVEVKVIKFEDYRTYPDAPIAIPEDRMGQSVIISMQTGGWF